MVESERIKKILPEATLEIKWLPEYENTTLSGEAVEIYYADKYWYKIISE